MSEQGKIKRKEKIILREENDTGLLCDPDTGSVSLINETGKFIWPLLDGTNRREDIVRQMLENFDGADKKELDDDLDKFITELGKNGLLENYNKPRTAPGNICFSITSKCNLNCKHCMNRSVSAAEPDMTTEELFCVIDQMALAGTKSISLFGGEPLCQPDFKRIVEYLNKAHMSISLNTNGTLIDRQTARWLKENKIHSAVVSFDGSSASVMDKMRGEGAFAGCLKGIEALRMEGVGVLLSTTLNKLNYKDIRNMVLLGKKIDGSAIRFNHVFFTGNAACFIKEIYLSPEEEKEAIEAVWKAKEEFGNFIYPGSSFLSQKEKFEKVKEYHPVQDKIICSPCAAATKRCAIRPDGWVVPCEIIWEVKCGNLKEKTFREIWEDSEVMNSFRKPLEIDLDQLPECKGCQLQYMCFLGHRCYPFYYPGGVANRSLYCWRKKELNLI